MSRDKFFFVSLFTVLLLANVATAKEPRWAQVRDGAQRFRVGAHQEAIDTLQPLVAQGDKLGRASSAAAYILARSYAAQGKGQLAAQALKQAARRARGVYPPAWSFARVEVLLAQGKVQDAFKRLSNLRSKHPKFRWAQLDLLWSRLYEKVGPPVAAAEASLKLIKKSRLHLPGDELLARAARLFTRAGKIKRAKSLWRRFLLTYPESALVSEAVKVVSVASLSDKQRLARAELLFKRRDYERCRAESLYLWNKGLYRDSVGYLLGKIGSERLRDDYPGAVRYFKAAIGKEAPYGMFALASYGIALGKVGKYREAVKAFDLWLKRHADEKSRRVNEVMYDRCRTIRGWGKPLRAAREYEAFLLRYKNKRRKGFDFGKYWWFVGFWRYLGGKYNAAIDIFDDLTFSRNALVGGKARYWTGKALEKLGRKKKAIAVWNKLVRGMPLNYYSAMAEDNLRRLGATAKLPRRYDLSKVPYRKRTPFKGLKLNSSLRRLQLAAHMVSGTLSAPSWRRSVRPSSRASVRSG